MKKLVLFSLLLLPFAACHRLTDAERAQERVNLAATLVDSGKLSQAKIELDSVHLLYPREVEVRRAAKHLHDSIVYIESARTLAYSDSVLQPLLVQADKLLKQFRYDKNKAYEEHGKYVHRLLYTGTNAARCYLQAYVSDERQTTLKSYYYGSKALHQQAITLTANDMEWQSEGSNHAFEAEGWHEILTLQEDKALQALSFISANKGQRLKVTLQGRSNYVYYLQANEKEALEQTYRLGILMKDIRQLEENIRIAQGRIDKWERK